MATFFSENDILKFRSFIYELSLLPQKHLLRNDILIQFGRFCEKSGKKKETKRETVLYYFLSKIQELLNLDDSAIFLYRDRIAHHKFYRFIQDGDHFEELKGAEFLDYRETTAGFPYVEPEKKLLIDFQPFYSFGPTIRDYKKIGSGQRFLNSYMAGKLMNETEKWSRHLCDFLKIHSINNEQILVDGNIIKDPYQLFEALQKAIIHLEHLPSKSSITKESPLLRSLGFKDGFGSTNGRVLETMQLLADLMETPEPNNLENFISRIPMISRVAIISPHGWFGQENVLGRPDTGGQIVYILDQVKALEKFLAGSLKTSGLTVAPKIIVVTRLIPQNECTCSNQRMEKIHGTHNSWILRIPFKDKDLNIIPHWISRFHVWPYLEQFALDAKIELQMELGGKPDLIIGNYSDGNLVASLLSSWLKVIQCNIAHALEKSKYLFSALYWENLEKEYKFSLQFTADLIAMNKADIIISSTSQEIAGNDVSMGQYESYCLFSMPGLYKVTHGINLFHPKFNVMSPGVDEAIYFPHFNYEKRLQSRIKELNQLLFTQSGENIFGHLDAPEKTPVFTMARLDKVKNVTGLVESYGQNHELQEKTNLILIAGTIHLDHASGDEEIAEVKKMYDLIEQYQLDGKIRWLGIQVPKADTGEIYRIIADRKGVFVQPALFEAFGLTVLEAMVSGLPVFATQFGGPVEIIENGRSGFLINPTHPELLTKEILEFLIKTETDSHYWRTVSNQAVARVRKCYNWKLYSDRLLKFAKLYGFWNYSAWSEEKKEVDQYCNLLFHLFFKKRLEGKEDEKN